MSFLENSIPKGFQVDCNGSFPLGKRNFRCWKPKGHGRVNFRKAIRESCDVFFYKASIKVGIDKIHDTMQKFGFGQKTGIDQINEFYGINPNKLWKRKKYKLPWYQGETVNSSIGQGNVLTTPMQIARYTAFLATGKLPTPHIYLDNYKEPVAVEHDENYLKMIKKGMYDVANHRDGTAYKHIRNSKVTMAAKTGTAQVISISQSEKKRMKESELEYYHRSHAWLTTYAPFNKPKYVITVLVEHGGHGGSAAGGMVGNLYNKMIELGYKMK